MADELNVIGAEVDEEQVNLNSGWTVGEDIVPSVHYQCFLGTGAWNSDDESVYHIWVEDPSEFSGVAGPVAEVELVINDEELPEESSVKELVNITANKWGFANPYEVAYVEITPSAALAEEYPETGVSVVIDGKVYAGLGILNEPLKFNMDRDHRVVIDWSHGVAYESFRIVVNR